MFISGEASNGRRMSLDDLEKFLARAKMLEISGQEVPAVVTSLTGKIRTIRVGSAVRGHPDSR